MPEETAKKIKIVDKVKDMDIVLNIMSSDSSPLIDILKIKLPYIQNIKNVKLLDANNKDITFQLLKDFKGDTIIVSQKDLKRTIIKDTLSGQQISLDIDGDGSVSEQIKSVIQIDIVNKEKIENIDILMIKLGFIKNDEIIFNFNSALYIEEVPDVNISVKQIAEKVFHPVGEELKFFNKSGEEVGNKMYKDLLNNEVIVNRKSK